MVVVIIVLSFIDFALNLVRFVIIEVLQRLTLTILPSFDSFIIDLCWRFHHHPSSIVIDSGGIKEGEVLLMGP